jgi:hypothetical protein
LGFGNLGDRFHEHLRVLGLHTFSKISAYSFRAVDQVASPVLQSSVRSDLIESKYSARLPIPTRPPPIVLLYLPILKAELNLSERKSRNPLKTLLHQWISHFNFTRFVPDPD